VVTTYFFAVAPILAIAFLTIIGRTSSLVAGLSGALIAAAIAVTAAPVILTPMAALAAAAKGLWLAWLVGAVIFAGLFFREIVSNSDDAASIIEADDVRRRRRAFAACFLIGPFAEAATGFGIGQVATIALLRSLGLEPLYIVLLALFSQVLVPWGAMANGTLVGAQLSGVTPHSLGLYSALLSLPLLIAWLALFWRICTSAGLRATRANLGGELGWVMTAIMLLVAANVVLGPEIAAMAALGPLIVFRFWLDERPDRERWQAAARIGLPYAVLIAGLAASRSIPPLTEWLGEVGPIQPFANGPIWRPLLHPGSWLVAVACLTALGSGRAAAIGRAAMHAIARGSKAVTIISIYLVVAGIMTDSAMANALTQGLKHALGPYTLIATPLLGGAFGLLTGSSNASNGLLMPSQARLADGGIGVVWIAALQNTSAAALTMLSPARLTMGCALVGRIDLEHAVYARAWPLAAAALGVLIAAAALVLASS
jgi:lactate permease